MNGLQYIEPVALKNRTDDNWINRIATYSTCPNGHLNRPMMVKSIEGEYYESHVGAPWEGCDVGILMKIIRCSKCKIEYGVEIEVWSC